MNKRVKFIKVDVSSNGGLQDLAELCQIQFVPTILYYKNGKNVAEYTGTDVGQIAKLIKQHAKNSTPSESKC